MADDSEQPTQIISGSPTPPGSTATLEPHEPRLSDGGIGGPPPGRPPTGYGGDGSGDDDGGDDGDGGDRRIAILAAVIGILVVIVLFLLLKPDNKDDATVTTAATPTPVVTVAATAEPTPTTKATPESTPEPTATPAPTSTPNGGGATVGGSGPVLSGGSVTKFTVNQGDTVQFQVKNDQATTQEVHVHGYDKTFDVQPGETRSISFPATITGIFEIEFEATSTQIGELTVEP